MSAASSKKPNLALAAALATGVILLLAISIAPTDADESAFLTGTTATGTCTDVANALTADDTRAICADGQTVSISGFALDTIVPTGAVIGGFSIQAQALVSNSDGTDVLDIDLSWDGGASFSNDLPTTSINSENSDSTVGITPCNHFGRDWTLEELSDANFALRATANPSSGGQTIEIDQIAVSVCWELPAENPDLELVCGYDIVLVLDTSTSVDNDELADMLDGFENFVRLLLPGTPMQFSIISFDDSAVLQSGWSGDVETIAAAIQGTDGSGFTNWEAALQLAHAQFASDRPGTPDVIAFTSDGNPTTSNSVGGTDINQPNAHLAPAIAAANAIKEDGITIYAVGIGDDLHADYLAAIADESRVFTTDFDTIFETLAEIAFDLCSGAVTVQKVVDTDGSLETTADRVTGGDLVEGWAIDVATGPGDSISPGSAVTNTDGIAGPFSLVFDADNLATLTITETQLAGFSLLDVTCESPGGPVPVTTIEDGVQVTIAAPGIVGCTFINGQAAVTPIPGPTEPPGPSPTAAPPGSLTPTVTATPGVDLAIFKTGTPNPYVPGAPLTYTVVVTNEGQSEVEGAIVIDDLPSALEHFGWACTATPGSSCSAASGQGSVQIIVDLLPGGAATFVISGVVPPGTVGQLVNTASVLPPAGSVDLNPVDNVATVSSSSGQALPPASPIVVPPNTGDAGLVAAGLQGGR